MSDLARCAGRGPSLARFSGGALLVVAQAAFAAALSGAAIAIAWAAGGESFGLRVVTSSGEIIVAADLPPDGTWRLEWTHSVAQVQVVDVFAWQSETMLVTEQYTPFIDIAGLGAFAGRGRLTELSDGTYHITEIDLPLHGNVHNLIIGSSRAPTVLIVGTDRFELSKTHPATHARIEVTQR